MVWAAALAPPSAAGDGLHRGLSTAAIFGEHGWGHLEQGTALMCLEGQIPVALHEAEPDCLSCSTQSPADPGYEPETRSFLLGKLVGHATANWELFVVSYHTSAG